MTIFPSTNYLSSCLVSLLCVQCIVIYHIISTLFISQSFTQPNRSAPIKPGFLLLTLHKTNTTTLSHDRTERHDTSRVKNALENSPRRSSYQENRTSFSQLTHSPGVVSHLSFQREDAREKESALDFSPTFVRRQLGCVNKKLYARKQYIT